MSDMAKHAPEKSSAKVAAWSVLITMGGTSVTYNIWHALHSGRMVLLLAILEGLAPVGAAMGLSEVGARFDSGPWFKAGAFGVMGGAMALSMNATAAVVRPAQGNYGSWLFGLVLDAAALLCLYVILTERERAARREKATRAAAAEEAARAAQAPAVPASAPAPRTAGKRSSHAAPKPRMSARRSDTADDDTTELRAIQMLDAHPELKAKGKGSELGRRLGVSTAHGRRLHARLTSEELPAEPLPPRSGERVQERSEERS